MILLVSSKSEGMNRSAMLMIMAMSLTGTLTSLRGASRLSVPSAMATGVVVRGSSDAPLMSNMRRKVTFMVVCTPSSVMVSARQLQSTSPPFMKKRLMTAATVTMRSMPRTDLSTDAMGSRAMRMTTRSSAAVTMNPK